MGTKSAPAIALRWALPRPRRRVRTPTVLQMEAVECGAAALAIVMAYHGRVVSLEELRVAAGVSRDGSKAVNMLKAARGYGFQASGHRKSVEALRRCPLPAIIFWNFNHFVVLEGFGRGKVFLNDPAHGRRSVSDEEFDSSFTGVALLISPGEGFVRGGRRPALLGALWRRLRGSLPGVAYVLLASLGLTLLGVVAPAFTRIFIDLVLVSGLPGVSAPLLAVMALSALGMAGFSLLQQRALLRLETKLAIAGSGRFLWHILRLPIDFFQQRRAADISVRVGSNDRVAALLSSVVAANLLNLVLIVCYLLVMVRYNLWLTLLGVGVAGLNLLCLQLMARRQVDSSQRLMSAQGKFMATALNGLQLIETLKATGAEGDFFVRWSGHQASVVNAERESGVARELATALPTTLALLNTAALVVVGGLAIIDGGLSIGGLLAFQALMAAFLLPVNQLVSLGSRFQQTEADITRLDDVMRYPVDPAAAAPPAAAGAVARKLAGRVELRGVTFGYSRLEPPLIRDFSLSVAPGARVALVGGSGSGKSTLARLVAGLYRPWSGEVLLDGAPREALPPAQLTASLALVDQEIYLFAGSIRDNLTMWNRTIPEASVIRAAKDALIHDDISGRPGGYEHLVAEGGANFSGGQRQRLEIARALAGDPTLLVLDEATSALDPLTEQRIDDQLRRRGCTCLIVAHRLSTIRDCDEIIVLERGQVVQRGTHDQLMREREGSYARLLRAEGGAGAGPGRVLDLI